MEYNKLVRDRIPEIISAHGSEPIVETLGLAAYRTALLNKLIEEATELRDSDGSLEERADVAEVLLALDRILNVDADELEAIRARKAHERGSFNDRIWLERVEERS